MTEFDEQQPTRRVTRKLDFETELKLIQLLGSSDEEQSVSPYADAYDGHIDPSRTLLIAQEGSVTSEETAHLENDCDGRCMRRITGWCSRLDLPEPEYLPDASAVEVVPAKPFVLEPSQRGNSLTADRAASLGHVAASSHREESSDSWTARTTTAGRHRAVEVENSELPAGEVIRLDWTDSRNRTVASRAAVLAKGVPNATLTVRVPDEVGALDEGLPACMRHVLTIDDFGLESIQWLYSSIVEAQELDPRAGNRWAKALQRLLASTPHPPSDLEDILQDLIRSCQNASKSKGNDGSWSATSSAGSDGLDCVLYAGMKFDFKRSNRSVYACDVERSHEDTRRQVAFLLARLVCDLTQRLSSRDRYRANRSCSRPLVVPLFSRGLQFRDSFVPVCR